MKSLSLRLGSLLGLGLVGILAAGCTTTPPMGYTRPVTEWPAAPASGPAPSISIYCNEEWYFDLGVPPKLTACSKHVVKVFEESRQFSKIYNGAAGGDYRADMILTGFHAPANMLAMFGSAFVAFLIPVETDQYVNLSTTISDARGKTLERMFYTEGYATRFGFFGSMLPSDSGIGAMLKRTLADLAHRGTLAAPTS